MKLHLPKEVWLFGKLWNDWQKKRDQSKYYALKKRFQNNEHLTMDEHAWYTGMGIAVGDLIVRKYDETDAELRVRIKKVMLENASKS